MPPGWEGFRSNNGRPLTGGRAEDAHKTSFAEMHPGSRPLEGLRETPARPVEITGQKKTAAPAEMPCKELWLPVRDGAGINRTFLQWRCFIRARIRPFTGCRAGRAGKAAPCAPCVGRRVGLRP